MPGLMLVLGANLIDLLPNAGLVNYVWLMAGALSGLALSRPVEETGKPEAEEAPGPQWGTRQPQAAPSWLMPRPEAPVQRQPREARARRPAR
jgi:hypothetical protein